MRITFKFEGKPKKIETDSNTIEDMIKNMNICTESVLVKRNGKFVPAEEKLNEDDEIELINIVSSG